MPYAMFSGIVQTTAMIQNAVTKGDIQRITISLPDIEGLKIGASIAVNGCCLTVCCIDGHDVSFDLIFETLQTIAPIKENDRVNIERSLKLHDEVGGHLLSGHILGRATISQLQCRGESKTIWLQVNEKIGQYLYPKGSIALDGVSLTLGDIDHTSFCVHLIPETLKITTWDKKRKGDVVNVEIDPMSLQIHQILKAHR